MKSNKQIYGKRSDLYDDTYNNLCSIIVIDDLTEEEKKMIENKLLKRFFNLGNEYAEKYYAEMEV